MHSVELQSFWCCDGCSVGCAAGCRASKESEFVAVYGRRRIGKTYLVREFFKGKFLFQHTGIEKGGFLRQLAGFRDSLIDSGCRDCPLPGNWTEAFRLLKELVERSRQARKVIFIDEMPWMDTPRSEFVFALEHFWNAWMSARKDVVLVICALHGCLLRWGHPACSALGLPNAMATSGNAPEMGVFSLGIRRS